MLFLAAFLLARNKPRLAVVIGLTVAANGLLMALPLAIGRQLFVNHLAGTVFGPASRIFYDTLLSYLERSQRVMFFLGATLVVMGWFAGRNASGTAVRTTSAEGLEAVGAALASTPVVATTGKWGAANIRWLRLAAARLGVIVLLWGNDISQSRFFWSLTVVLVLLACLQVLIGAGRSTDPTDRSTPAPSEQGVADNT
ncbi:hypothetical protein EKO23_14095 [Nocardioides guangzhouensis]|uniref:Uncharacterized protein n=1 Tax=Nocardioides guangzhouensis TaxID=2497878 RepID=A0A4Q4ZC58_9ACTN|nr:hypothetical protein [Nocardioides guangzhouensis]RYP84901.1 hypothetical protein EKO23_14095 [Nocardioides guangzhouensis]